MATYDVAFIGTGPEPENPVWGESAAMAYRHGEGYRELDACDIVACADLVRENAADFAAEFGIDDDCVFEDHIEMLETVEPNVVSIATPVPTHADLVVSAAETGVPDAIHCEKPMADTWGDSERMADACEQAGIQLTFNHQRRFEPRWRHAKELLDDGEIGELQRLEVGGKNLFDFGTHLIDLANFYNDEHAADWALAGLDYRSEDVRYGSHNENQSVVTWCYENGVHGFASTGRPTGQDVVDAHNRLIGSDGIIEVNPYDADAALRINRFDDEGWTAVDLEGTGSTAIGRGIEHLIECLDAGVEPELGAANALRAMEIIFGAYESVRSHGRVEFPLEREDNALNAMVESGELDPQPDGE